MTFNVQLSNEEDHLYQSVFFSSDNRLQDIWNKDGTLNFSDCSNDQLITLLKTAVGNAEFNMSDVFSFRSGEFRGPYIHYAHDDQRQKLETSLPVYLIAFMALLFLYVRRRQAYRYLFKFSKLSKIIYSYFAVKLIFSLVYFVFLVAVFEFEYKKVRSPWIFFIYSVLRAFLSVTPYMLLALFSFGYGVKFFTLEREKSALAKSAIMTILFSISSFSSIYEEYVYITADDQSRFRDFGDVNIVEVVSVVTRVVAILLLALSVYRTYKDTEEYPVVKKSAAIVIAVYFLKPMVVFPPPGEVFRFFTHLFLPDEFYGYSVPDIVELLALPFLMYIWRDIDGDYVEVKDMESSEL
ncbi:hypothetical protein JA9_002103 [Meyerozyma sp. JA9]|nr:hypothetical protein JA9_002103 [Meyerozyma sp. JA9]